MLKTINKRLRNHLGRFEELNLELSRNGKILVVNCGYGDLCYLLAKCADEREVYGFDDDADKLEVMRNVGGMPQNVTIAETADKSGYDAVVNGVTMDINAHI